MNLCISMNFTKNGNLSLSHATGGRARFPLIANPPESGLPNGLPGTLRDADRFNFGFERLYEVRVLRHAALHIFPRRKLYSPDTTPLNVK